MTTEERLERPKRRNHWTLTVALIVFVSLYQQASARIGETPEQCEVRYGKPVRIEKKDESKIYLKTGFRINIFFIEGKAVTMIFEKMDKDLSRISHQITTNEVQSLLQSNSGGKEWEEVMLPEERRRVMTDKYWPKLWKTKDGERKAVWDTSGHRLLITTTDLLKNVMPEDENVLKKKMEGF